VLVGAGGGAEPFSDANMRSTVEQLMVFAGCRKVGGIQAASRELEPQNIQRGPSCWNGEPRSWEPHIHSTFLHPAHMPGQEYTESNQGFRHCMKPSSIYISKNSYA
jgi:hypothetical protein